MPIHIQDKVVSEIRKTIREGHTNKLDKFTIDQFKAPVVITVKKNGSVKLAMNAKLMNDQIFNNNFQKPKLLELLDSAARITTSDTSGVVWFTKLDLKFSFT